jgi:hypothetical protein
LSGDIDISRGVEIVKEALANDQPQPAI